MASQYRPTHGYRRDYWYHFPFYQGIAEPPRSPLIRQRQSGRPSKQAAIVALGQSHDKVLVIFHLIFSRSKEDDMAPRKLVLIFCFFVLALSLPVSANAAPPTDVKGPNMYSAALGVEYGSGDYGTDITTDAVTTKLILGWKPMERLLFSLEIPYLYQSNSVTTSFGMGRFRTGSMQQVGGTQRPMRNGSSSFASTFDVTKSQSGLGDLVLKGGCIIYTEEDRIPEIRPEAYVKFPTADKNKGLGTGEFDGGVGVALNKWLDSWNGYFEGVYNFIGKSQDFKLNNFFSYEAGVGYKLSERFMPAIGLKGATSPGEGSPAPFEMRIKALYNITGTLGVDGYLAKGFSDGSPDYGLGAEISFQF
jgi:Fe-S-cluster containining protein